MPAAGQRVVGVPVPARPGDADPDALDQVTLARLAAGVRRL